MVYAASSNLVLNWVSVRIGVGVHTSYHKPVKKFAGFFVFKRIINVIFMMKMISVLVENIVKPMAA